jgi:hypothetical protein
MPTTRNHRQHATPRAVYAKLPQAPVTASPAPGLTSLYHFDSRHDHGDRSYPGNCGGRLIRDLLRFFWPENVLDPMSGSGTCSDVCVSMGIPCISADLKTGFDACDRNGYSGDWRFDFVWLHPPYWRQKRYSDQPQDLSTCRTLDDFLRGYRQLIENCAAVLAPQGRLAILMGDYCDHDAGFVPLTFYTKQLAFAVGLVQPCTDIVRFSHGATSGRKVYRSAFIPNLHDVCMIFAPTGRQARTPQTLPPRQESTDG